MKLVVTIPALNEEKTIAQVIEGVPRKIPGVDEIEVIVVNDGSTDRTMRRGADVIVNIDGDGQFDPADIAKLVQPILDGEADFVTCSRFSDPALRPTMPAVKFWG